ncbi:LysR substrate-binding domain-containing protein [Nocardia takedensis]|uniref:LysR substrate-binding domain-containing protein n=1 Tax=Nocardia takedensis TaxID=259390 RepID=UPI003F7611F7
MSRRRFRAAGRAVPAALAPLRHTRPELEVVLTQTECAQESWILERGRTRFLLACQEAGFTPRIAATSDDQLTIHSLVANGIGVAIINELGVSAHTHPGVVVRPLRGWPTRRISALLWPDLLRSVPVAALLTALGTAARGLGLGAAA